MTSPFVSAADLARELASDSPPLVFDASYLLHKPEFDGDYRSQSAYDQWEEAHIPGSRYIDIQKQFADQDAPTHHTHPEPQAIADELARLGIDERDSVVVYDTTQTMFAARLWYLLTWIGVRTRVLDGGLAAWRAAGEPVASGPREPVASVNRWTAHEARGAWIDKDELAARSADDSRPLVCGLPAGSFTGADASRYSRRGHIPGSVNVSSRDLFSSAGTVRPESEVRDAYRAEGIDGSEEVLLYCGGGISASANALTLAALGVTAVRIYDGSLEEWSADAALPLDVTAPAV